MPGLHPDPPVNWMISNIVQALGTGAGLHLEDATGGFLAIQATAVAEKVQALEVITLNPLLEPASRTRNILEGVMDKNWFHDDSQVTTMFSAIDLAPGIRIFAQASATEQLGFPQGLFTWAAHVKIQEGYEQVLQGTFVYHDLYQPPEQTDFTDHVPLLFGGNPLGPFDRMILLARAHLLEEASSN